MPRDYNDSSHIERRDARRLSVYDNGDDCLDPEDEAVREEIDAPTCPQCESHASECLGQLGNLGHYRCRSCGWLFSSNGQE
jgi:rubredoxin